MMIDETLLCYRNIFNVDLPATTDGNRLFELINKGLSTQSNIYQDYREQYFGKYPFGIHFNALCQKLDSWVKMRDPKRLFGALKAEQESVRTLYDQCKSLVDFTSRAMDAYISIQTFYNENKDNFASLEPEEQEKADMVGDFFRSDDPALSFRHIRKAYNELKTSINQLRESLLNKTLEVYEQIFSELDAETKKLGLTQSHIHGDKESNLTRIRKIKSITALRYELSNAPAFKSEQLGFIIKYAAKNQPSGDGLHTPQVGEPKVFYITKLATVIRSEKDLDEYLDKAKTEMLALLKEKKNHYYKIKRIISK